VQLLNALDLQLVDVFGGFQFLLVRLDFSLELLDLGEVLLLELLTLGSLGLLHLDEVVVLLSVSLG
jgi:hypothetical protein